MDNPVPVHIIRPTRGLGSLRLGELWRYRELLMVFTKRNVLVRYKQTALGAAWAILQPFFLMVVFTVFFRRLGNVSSGGLPYPVFVYAGLLPWLLFSNSMVQSSQSLVANQNLIRKVYFPRLVIPISTVLTCFVDFLVASVVLVALMVYYDTYPDPVRLLLLPPLLVLALCTALGVGLWLAALNVVYRDVQYIVPFLSQIWLFATPAVYAVVTLSQPWKTLIGLNPMEGVVQGFRWALLSQGQAPGGAVAISIAVTLVLVTTGIVFFKQMERSFADVV